MEGMSDFVSKYVPSFARGLEILLVDHDAISLVIMAAMLEQCSYKVTTTNQASVALSMIRELENHFRLVIANNNMPDMDMLSFLRASHQKGVPVILTSSERNAEVADRALAEGACLVLTKPVTLDELKYLWQHACWKNVNLVEESVQQNCQGKGTSGKEFGGIKINETITLPWSPLEGNMIKQADRPPAEVKETKEAGGLSSSAIAHNVREHVANDAKGKKKRTTRKSCIIIDDQAKQSENTSLEELITAESKTEEGSKAKVPIRDREGKKQEERSKLNSELENSESSMIIEKGKKRKRNTDSSKDKSSRAVWDPSLHRKFTTAISVLGDKKAQPKTIQQEMNVPHITTRQVASHLQKYKAEVQKIQDNDTSLISTSKASNIHAISQFPPPLERQSSLLCQMGHGNIDLGVTSNPWSSSYYTNNTKEGNTIQVAKMNLPNLSYAPSKAASPCLPAGMVRLPGLHPQANQNQDLASVFISKYQNQPSVGVGNATNSKTFETEGSQYIDAVVNQATAVGPSDHDQTLSEYDDILRILEEDAEDFNYLSSGQTIDDFDKYCELLEKTLDAKDNDL
ncbi:Two-component response regulator [Trema orientale]|uniref:Two-component response regulator n=1 Tax=Trema orientale TaxID=63057 RepID=A0A2P5EN86_TREOI|nr:Two-component response regulator [Trema orientale]